MVALPTQTYQGPRPPAGNRSGASTPGFTRWLRTLDPWVLLLTVGLVVVGPFCVYAAAYGLSGNGAAASSYLHKDLLNSAIGLGLALGASRIPIRLLRTVAPVLYGLTVLALLAVLSPLGSTINGAHAWFSLGAGFQLEPSEFAKITLILLLADLLAELQDNATAPRRREILLAFAISAGPLVLVLAEPALGVAIVLAVLALTLLAVSGVSRTVLWSLVALAVIGGVGIGEFHLLKPYQQARFTSFVHPAAADPGGIGYQTQQAEAAIGGGGLTGEGFLKGQLTNGRFIPEQQTDFAFTVAAEETGFAGASVVLVLLGGLSLRALRIAARAPDRYGRLVAAGIGTWFGVQTFVNVGMTLGIMPVTGLPLPFVSYGGSALFCSLIAVGILLAVDARGEPA